MIHFREIKKIKYILSLVIFIKYSSWTLFFILQGKSITLAINNHTICRQLMETLIEFILIKIIVMMCDVLQKFIMEYFKNIVIKNKWDEHFPMHLYSDNQDKINEVSQLFFDILPKLFELEISMVINWITVIFIFSLSIAVFLYNKIYIGVFILAVIFFLNYLSRNIFTKKIDLYQEKSYTQNIKIMNWIDQYFASYREISKNWLDVSNSSWKYMIYEKYFFAKKDQIIFYLYRDLLCQLLVELPFLVTMSAAIVGVYFNYLSIAQLFIWTGFSQFMITASNAYLDNKVKKLQRSTLYFKSNEILSRFQFHDAKHVDNKIIDDSILSVVKLRDGTENLISLASGIYPIKGKNGSGKSTLINMILNFDRTSQPFENTHFDGLMVAINPNNTRLIEREAVVFECFDDFNSQILGPINVMSAQWINKINPAMDQLLDKMTSYQWRKIFTALEQEYIARSQKILSSGEKVILSMMRFLASWNDKVNLLIIDECDSFLDSHKKSIFIDSINQLASRMAIYICTHDSSLCASLCDKKGIEKSKSRRA